MAVSSGISFVVSMVLVILLFSGLQANKQWITSSPAKTIIGGFTGSLIFLFSVTAVGNLESMLFGKHVQMKLFPEVAACYFLTFLSTATVHRICVTSALLLSTISLYYMNNLSQKVYNTPVAVNVPVASASTKKKKH